MVESKEKKQTPFLQTELVTSQGKDGLEQDSKSIKKSCTTSPHVIPKDNYSRSIADLHEKIDNLYHLVQALNGTLHNLQRLCTTIEKQQHHSEVRAHAVGNERKDSRPIFTKSSCRELEHSTRGLQGELKSRQTHQDDLLHSTTSQARGENSSSLTRQPSNNATRPFAICSSIQNACEAAPEHWPVHVRTNTNLPHGEEQKSTYNRTDTRSQVPFASLLSKPRLECAKMSETPVQQEGCSNKRKLGTLPFRLVRSSSVGTVTLGKKMGGLRSNKRNTFVRGSGQDSLEVLDKGQEKASVSCRSSDTSDLQSILAQTDGGRERANYDFGLSPSRRSSPHSMSVCQTPLLPSHDQSHTMTTKSSVGLWRLLASKMHTPRRP